MKMLVIAVTAISLAACSTLDLNIGAVHQVVPQVSGVQIVPDKVRDCEIVFRAWDAGRPVTGCLYRPYGIGPMKARFW